MALQITNGNQGAITSPNGSGFYTTVWVNCRNGFTDADHVTGKSHRTEAGAWRWARKQIGLPAAPLPPKATAAEAAMDRDLAEAATLLPPGLTIDRCRHESVTATSLWIFDADGKQIASISRHLSDWKANRMERGMPTSQRFTPTLAAAIAHLTEERRP